MDGRNRIAAVGSCGQQGIFGLCLRTKSLKKLERHRPHRKFRRRHRAGDCRRAMQRELIAQAGRFVAADEVTARMAGLKCDVFPNAAALAAQVDLLLVFGGDGTMLGAVREIDGSTAPMLGINVGRLGFLTAVSSRDLAAAIDKLWRGDFVVETRPLIEATGECGGQPLRNDARSTTSSSATGRGFPADRTECFCQ